MNCKDLVAPVASLMLISAPLGASAQTQEQKDTVGYHSETFYSTIELCPHLITPDLVDRCKSGLAACLARSDPRQVTDVSVQAARWETLGTCSKQSTDPIYKLHMETVKKLTKDRCYGIDLVWDSGECWFEPK